MRQGEREPVCVELTSVAFSSFLLAGYITSRDE
jgi:hypothetical protein